MRRSEREEKERKAGKFGEGYKWMRIGFPDLGPVTPWTSLWELRRLMAHLRVS